MTHEFIVEDLKIRLDRYLANQLPQISRSRFQKDIKGGQVEVNGEIISESKFVVRLDDKVVYRVTSEKLQVTGLQATNTPIKVLYDNHGLLIIDKPAGMTVHPGAGFKGETLASALLYHYFFAKGGSASGGKDIKLVGEEGRPGIVHRLDKDTSGVILVAKTQEMYEFLKDAFAERKIKKEYIALVSGRLEKNHGIIDTPIGRSKTDFRKYTAKNPVEAKPSVTEYKVLEYLHAPTFNFQLSLSAEALAKEEIFNSPGVDTYTLIMVKLHTGRTHQIRVHFASIGHPLMGDELYGNKNTRLPNLHRQFLHAKKIEVQLSDKTWIEAESDFPKDLKEVLESLNSKLVKRL